MPTVANSMMTGHFEYDEEVYVAHSQKVAVVFAKVLALVKGGQLTLAELDIHTDTQTHPTTPHTHTTTHTNSHQARGGGINNLTRPSLPIIADHTPGSVWVVCATMRA